MKVSDHVSCNGAVDLELVDKLRHGDSEELGSLLGDSLVCLSIEEDCVVLLFLYLDLGPALLLGLSASTGFLAISSLAFGLILCGIILALICLLCL